MAKSLKDAVAQVQALIEAIAGINGIPTDVPAFDDTTVYPFWIALPGSGTVTAESYGQKRGIHTIRGELHYSLADLKRAIPSLPDYVETITDTLLDPDNLTLSSTVDTVISVAYAYEAELGYATEITTGYVFDVEVKIRKAI